MSEIFLFERKLVAKFRDDREVKVLINEEDSETPTQSMDRVARRVIDIMQTYDLYDEAGPGEHVISNMRYDEDYGWVYSVRIQRDEKQVETDIKMDGARKIFVASLPEIDDFTAHVDAGEDFAFLNKVSVPIHMRRRGIATEMISKLADLLVENNIELLTSDVDSPHTIRVFRKLFGDDAIIIQSMSGEVLNLTVEEAIELLSENKSGEPIHKFRVDVDINP